MPVKGFEYKCICDWSKDDKNGFIPYVECPVHGKEQKKIHDRYKDVKRL